MTVSVVRKHRSGVLTSDKPKAIKSNKDPSTTQNISQTTHKEVADRTSNIPYDGEKVCIGRARI